MKKKLAQNWLTAWREIFDVETRHTILYCWIIGGLFFVFAAAVSDLCACIFHFYSAVENICKLGGIPFFHFEWLLGAAVITISFVGGMWGAYRLCWLFSESQIKCLMRLAFEVWLYIMIMALIMGMFLPYYTNLELMSRFSDLSDAFWKFGVWTFIPITCIAISHKRFLNKCFKQK